MILAQTGGAGLESLAVADELSCYFSQGKRNANTVQQAMKE